MIHKTARSRKERVTLAVGDRGRVVLPARLRRSLGLRPGDLLVVEVDDDQSLRLTPRRVLVERCRGAFADLRGETSVVDELIAERRAEAARED